MKKNDNSYWPTAMIISSIAMMISSLAMVGLMIMFFTGRGGTVNNSGLASTPSAEEGTNLLGGAGTAPNSCDCSCLAKCSSCGNGKIDSGEDCDKTNLNGKTCKILGYTTGSLTCGSNCKFSTKGCSSVCGNYMVETGEECDSNDEIPCRTFGKFYEGIAPCVKCQYDKSACEILS